MKHNGVVLSYVWMLDVWECKCIRDFWEVIILNHVDDGLWLSHFKMIKIAFEMVCNEINAPVSSVIQSHDMLRQIHLTFLMHIEEFILFINNCILF